MAKAAHADTLRLNSPIEDAPGVGPARARLFERLGVRTVGDLLRHLPMRHEFEAAEGGVDDLPVGAVGSVRGTIVAARFVPSMGFGKKGRFEATLRDAQGQTVSLTWFNARYLQDKLHPGMVLRVQGKNKPYNGYPQIVNPKWEALDDDEPPEAAERVRPIYPAAEDLPSRVIEKVVEQTAPRALPLVADPLPAELLHHHNMPALDEAYRMMHQPAHMDEAAEARRRLAFNELLLLQLGIAMKRRFVQDRLTAPPLPHNAAIDEHIRERFPFELTPAQKKVVGEVADDLSKTRPMNRLVQGDVGAGKTVVALYGLLMAVLDRKQGALMAPTELLAEQHFASISAMLEGSSIRLALFTGARNGERAETLDAIKAGEVDIVVGTHALLSDTVAFHDLALMVIDEQHRFGVMQRAAFRMGPKDAPIRRVPHHLVMTATPIPRTLSLTVFGDLDVSTIDTLPPGRIPVTNRVVGQDKSDEVYRYLNTRLERGEQAYIVVPTIDAAGHETAQQLKSVNELAKLIQDKYCGGFKVAAVHGRLKRETRQRIMDRFRRGEVHVLVATTVIEVGVDVPNASVMIIEHAERFGLAQLHQLRGRVGRGDDGRRSLCVFIAEPTTEDGRKRMDAIASSNDGFKIAEMDLQIRGMGDFFGTRQSGAAPLKVAAIPDDMDLLLLARRDAQKMVDADPYLTHDDHLLLRKVLLQHHGEALGLIDVG